MYHVPTRKQGLYSPGEGRGEGCRRGAKPEVCRPVGISRVWLWVWGGGGINLIFCATETSVQVLTHSHT